MKKNLLVVLFAASFSACLNDAPQPVSKLKKTNGLSLVLDNNPEWQHENLRLYPVRAEASVIENQAFLKNMKTLAEAMQTQGFRITELKQFGRTLEHSVNLLTVQNKIQDAVFVMSGDVVTGGNQDRVVAQDQVVAANTVRNFEVFCVEKGRWHYDDSEATESDKNIYAFKGYYNVASPQVRQAVQRTGNQEAVWSAVAKVTSANNAESGTSAYTALETANDAKVKRDACLRYFDGKLDGQSDIVGMVVVCGDRVLGVDIFGHPDLFRRQYSSLLHGYVAEAMTPGFDSKISDNEAETAFQKVARLAKSDAQTNDEAGKFAVNEGWVHLYSK